MKVALIDGDIPAYHAAAYARASGKTEADARALAVNLVNDWVPPWLRAESKLVCLSSYPRWRGVVYSPYKANRKDPEPPLLQSCIQAIDEEFDTAKGDCLEADDVLGILSDSLINETVIVSIDKDLLQIPGWHWRPHRQQLVYQSEGNALYRFLTQWLIGDSTDNVPGIPGIGPKKAEKIIQDNLKSPGLGWVYDTYAKFGCDKDYCRKMGLCVYIPTSKGLHAVKDDFIDRWDDLITYLGTQWNDYSQSSMDHPELFKI